MQSIVVDLNISADEYLRHYRGVSTIVARARDGRRVQFPANLLRAHVSHNGVHGSFELQIDESAKLVNMRRLT